MNKTELVQAVFDANKDIFATRNKCATAIDSIIEIITEELAAGNKVQIIGTGTLHVKEIPAREARNIQTKEKITVPAHKAVRFTAGKTLKARVNA